MPDSAVQLDACKVAGALTPRQPDLALYTNTSPGKAVRVREASVFRIIRRDGPAVAVSDCGRSIFSFRLRSIWRSSSASAPGRQRRSASLEPRSACPADSMDKILGHFGHVIVNDMGYVVHVQTTDAISVATSTWKRPS
jgi:hypothetical protein